MPNNYRIGAYVGRTTKIALDLYAEQKGMTMSNVVRKFLEIGLMNEKEAFNPHKEEKELTPEEKAEKAREDEKKRILWAIESHKLKKQMDLINARVGAIQRMNRCTPNCEMELSGFKKEIGCGAVIRNEMTFPIKGERPRCKPYHDMFGGVEDVPN